MYLFNRSISINVQSEDGKMLIVNGLFIDMHHEICLTLTVDFEQYVILNAEGELIRTPQQECRQTKELLRNLNGLSLEKGVRKRIQAAVGLNSGCTHLVDLAVECVKGVLQAKFRLMQLSLSKEEFEQKLHEHLEGTCYYHNREHNRG